MIVKELKSFLQDIDDNIEIFIRDKHTSGLIELNDIQVSRYGYFEGTPCLILSKNDNKNQEKYTKIYTYEELRALCDKSSVKCKGCTNCYQCRYINLEKGKDCTDKYIELNYEKIIGDSSENEVVYYIKRRINHEKY